MNNATVALAVADALERLVEKIPDTPVEKVAESSILNTGHVLEFLKFFTVSN